MLNEKKEKKEAMQIDEKRIEEMLKKGKIFAYAFLFLLLLFIFYFNYYIENDATHHLIAVYLSKRHPDIFIFDPFAPASIYHTFSYLLYDFLHDYPYVIVLLYSLISLLFLAYSLYLFLKSRNALSFYFYIFSFCLSATYFTFHYMPAWALSQAIFFFLLALPFNLTNAIISVPLFYIFHPLAGFVYYGFRAIEAYEQKQPKNFYYAIFSGLLLVALNLFYMGLQYKGIENYYNPLYFLKVSLTNFLINNSFLPFFTVPLVFATVIISYIIIEKKNENEKFIPYLFFLSIFFLTPAIATTNFILGTRVLPLFLVYLLTKTKNDKRKEVSFLFSIFFGLALILIVLFISIFNSKINPVNIKGFSEFILYFCNEDLSERIINSTNKNLYVITDTSLCIFRLLSFRDLHTNFVGPRGHPITYNRDLLDYGNFLDYCKYFDVSVISYDKEETKKFLLLIPYVRVADFKEFYIIEVCKNNNYEKVK